MKIHRQLVFCWILGAFWLFAAAYVFIRPRTGSLAYPQGIREPTISWSYQIGSKDYGLFQVNKGTYPQFTRHFPKELPLSTKKAFMSYDDDVAYVIGAPKGYWSLREDGAQKTAAALIVADHAYPLPLPVEGIFLAVGLTIIAVPTLTIIVRQMKFQQNLPKETTTGL